MVAVVGQLWLTAHMTKSDAIKHFGSMAEVARAIGKTRQYVKKMPELLPDHYAALLEIRSNYQLRAFPSAAPNHPKAA